MNVRKLLCTLGGAILIAAPAAAQTGGTVESGIERLAEQIVARSAAADRTTIAISSFPHVDDTCSELSNFLVDELVLSLFSVPGSRLSIIERSQLSRIFAELELSMSGAVDMNTTRELGRIHGVETLLVGSLTTIGDDLRINARLIDTETGQVFSAAAVNIPRTSTIEDLMRRPAAGGCTMMPSGGGGRAAGAAPATGGAGMMLSAPQLESMQELGGEWFGNVICKEANPQVWFNADRVLGSGVSGPFRSSARGGWNTVAQGRGATTPSTASAPGSGTLMLKPASDSGLPEFVMTVEQQGTSAVWDLTLVAPGALVGTSRGEDCTEVSLGLKSQ